jgi:hypothetical protein
MDDNCYVNLVDVADYGVAYVLFDALFRGPPYLVSIIPFPEPAPPNATIKEFIFGDTASAHDLAY